MFLNVNVVLVGAFPEGVERWSSMTVLHTILKVIYVTLSMTLYT